MIHTLLSSAAKDVLNREYRNRALIVLCFMLSLAGLIGVASLIPAFIAVDSEARAATKGLASAGASVDAGASNIETDLVLENALLRDLATPVDGGRFSSIISSIASLRQNVRISSMSLSWVATTTANVVVSGMAPTRDSLISFKSRLESLVPSGKVDLPVSELAKSKDVDYSLQFSLPMK